MVIGTVEKAPREGFDPVDVRRWQRGGKQRPARQGAHRGHVRKVYGKGLPTQRFRLGAGQKMRVLDQQVRRDDEFMARRGRDQRAVIPDSEHRVARRSPEEALDQREFGRHGRLPNRSQGPQR